MTDNFKPFAAAVRLRFKEMSNNKMFIVDSDRDVIWQTYLDSFPPGTDPIFRVRTSHDCSCCKSFIRSIGNVVTIQNGAIVSVWDLNGLPEPYQTVADQMSAYVKNLPIRDVFLTPFATYGAENSRELLDDGTLIKWDHFSAVVPSKFVTSDYVEKMGYFRTTRAVFERGLVELNESAVNTVVDLIASNAIYRGQEFQSQIKEFQNLQSRFLNTSDSKARDLLVWSMLDSPVARFRNTVIGTLVQDLSEDVPLETAVRSYETKVAPTNYKRPTALITKGMVESAMKTINDLGLQSSLYRRHARLSDVSVNSVLFVDNDVKSKMKGGIESLLMEEVKPAAFNIKNAEEITIDDFMSKIMPKTTELQLYLDNSHLNNFVSLTAPVHEDAESIFKWNNNFAWSYDGNATDSIKDKVKKAGGQVDNVTMRVSLAWFNTDDLDLHVIEPDGNHIYYANKSSKLDVDMNVSRLVRDPVENIRWTSKMADGIYEIYVNNFTKRESIDVGFVVELESAAGTETFNYTKSLKSGQNQSVARIHVSNGVLTKVTTDSNIVKESASREKWGLKTLTLAKINSVVLSPNYWDDNAVGNKHWFFILESCKNPEPTRGIYNEFLDSKFEKHRKVFEVLGDKTKCPVDEEQLSGVGFSSTRKEKVTVMATGPYFNRPYTIIF